MGLILILRIIGLAWMITSFAPLQWLLDLLPNNLFKYTIVLLTSCIKCASFWIGLAMGGIWYGIVSSFLAMILNEIFYSLKDLWIRMIQKL